MTINELHIQLDLQPENRIDILKDVAAAAHYSKGYLFVDALTGYCYLFNKNGNEDDIKKLKKIDDYLFYHSSIESIIIPGSVENIGNSAFYRCESLTSIVIPDSVESIGTSIFEQCGSLKSVIISNSVKSIGNWAFCYCESLKSIVIPDSVKSIGYGAFACCENLKSIAFKGKAMKQVKAMENYPFGIVDESIIGCI